MVGERTRGWCAHDRCRFRYRRGRVVKVGHYVRLWNFESERVLQVVNKTPAPSVIGIFEFDSVFSNTNQFDSDGAGTSFLRVNFPGIPSRIVDTTFENDVRICDAGHS